MAMSYSLESFSKHISGQALGHLQVEMHRTMESARENDKMPSEMGLSHRSEYYSEHSSGKTLQYLQIGRLIITRFPREHTNLHLRSFRNGYVHSL